MLALLALLTTLTDGRSPPSCSVDDRPVVTRVADLPADVREPFLPMADAKGEFRLTDVIGPGQDKWPRRRLICGYPTRQGYEIEFEQGGIGYSVQRKLIRFKSSTTMSRRSSGG